MTESLSPHTSSDQVAPNHESDPPDLLGALNKVVGELEQKYQAFFAVAGSIPSKSNPHSDLDFKIVTESGDLPPQVLQEIISVVQEALSSLGLNPPIDIYQHQLSQMLQGKIEDPEETPYVEELIESGFDSETMKATLTDKSLLALYLYGSLHPVGINSQTEILPAKILDKINLTREGAISFMHFYAASFMYKYNSKSLTTPEEISAYSNRLGKYAIKVSLGSLLAQAPQDQLSEYKQKVAHSLSTENGHSNDGNLANFMIENFASSLSSRQIELLEKSAQIRDDNKTTFTKDEIQEVEEMILFMTNPGKVKREQFTGVRDSLLFLQLKLLAEQLGLTTAYDFETNEPLINPEEAGENIFLIPKTVSGKPNGGVGVISTSEDQINSDNSPRAMLVRTINSVRVRLAKLIKPDQKKLAFKPAGSVIGEIGLLFSTNRTATVIALEPIENVLKIPGKVLEDLFDDSKRAKRIRSSPAEMDKEDRFVAVFLRSILYEHIYLHADLAQVVSSNQTSTETPKSLKRDNLLVDYLIDDLAQVISSIPEKDLSSTTITTDKKQRITLFKKNEKAPSQGNLYVVKSGAVKLNDFPNRKGTAIIEAGGIIGLESLADLESHYYTAQVLPGSEVIKISVEEFKKYAYSNKNIPYNQESSSSLLFHCAAVLTSRVKNLLKISKPSIEPSNALSGLKNFKTN